MRAESEEFSGWGRQPAAGAGFKRPFCVGPVAYRGKQAVEVDIRNLKSALAQLPSVEGFLPCASLGVIEYTVEYPYYPASEAYLFALADVIDTTTNFVERPELVAQRIELFARVLGRENVMGGTDCGFGTFAGRDRVHAEIALGQAQVCGGGGQTGQQAPVGLIRYLSPVG